MRAAQRLFLARHQKGRLKLFSDGLIPLNRMMLHALHPPVIHMPNLIGQGFGIGHIVGD